VASVTYDVIPYLHVAVGTVCFELHRLDMCLFALRGGAGFKGVRQRLTVRKWLRDAGWILDQDRNGTKLVEVLPFLDEVSGGTSNATVQNHMWSLAFGC
jgi:hypothetical protein